MAERSGEIAIVRVEEAWEALKSLNAPDKPWHEMAAAIRALRSDGIISRTERSGKLTTLDCIAWLEEIRTDMYLAMPQDILALKATIAYLHKFSYLNATISGAARDLTE